MVAWKELSVVIFDPDARQARLVQEALRNLECWKIKNFQSPHEALHFLEEYQIDVALVAVDAKVEHGVQLINWLRKPNFRPNRHLPILGLVPPEDTATVRLSVRIGADYVIVPPVSTTALSQRIERLLTTPLPTYVTPNYTGPDRRRLPDKNYTGPDRRQD